ncbi:leucine-rich melanocyte differentiation-associated protein isoform X1 [Tachysurus ichikawai]
MAHSETGVVVTGTQVSYIGHDCELIPEFLAANYGSLAKRLDLSFNRLSPVQMICKKACISATEAEDSRSVVRTGSYIMLRYKLGSTHVGRAFMLGEFVNISQ